MTLITLFVRAFLRQDSPKSASQFSPTLLGGNSGAREYL